MVIEIFPPLNTADESGLLAIGGDLEIESLLLAYRSGIFPWPITEEGVLAWFSPWQRALLFFDEFHLSRSMQKKWRQACLSSDYTFKINSAFEKVIKHCADYSNRKSQDGTWITDEIIQAYIQFHYAGYAHSIECYYCGELVGGLYGVAIAGTFAGESMFYRKRDASKLALCYLVEYLKAKGVQWIDCQQLTPLLSSFGARELSRDRYLELLEESMAKEVKLF